MGNNLTIEDNSPEYRRWGKGMTVASWDRKNANKQNYSGLTPLAYTIEGPLSSSPNHIDYICQLLFQGVDISCKCRK